MKILVIGQAPPAQKQEYPYDTTQLYDWLKEVGVSKEKAQEMFEWEAVYNKFPGYEKNGAHKKPSIEQMDKHWSDELSYKVANFQKIWLLGRVAKDYFMEKTSEWNIDKSRLLFTIHPSNLTKATYECHKKTILNDIKNFLT